MTWEREQASKATLTLTMIEDAVVQAIRVRAMCKNL